MINQDITGSIEQYLKGLPNVDPRIVLDGLSLMHLHHEVDMLTEILSSRWGINARQMETLQTLFHHPDRSLTPAQLAEEVHLTRSAMTSNLDSLERKGYIARGAHKGDRRMIAVTLTETGIEYCEEKLPDRYRDCSRVIGVLTDEEKDTLTKAYKKIADLLNEILKENTIDLTEKGPSRA
jgi:DNA-binding MarR family transcriptional regulator